LVQLCGSTLGTAEEGPFRECVSFVACLTAQEDTGRERKNGAKRLDQSIEGDQEVGGHVFLEEAQAETAHSTTLANGQVVQRKVLADPGGVKIEVEGHKLDRFRVKR